MEQPGTEVTRLTYDDFYATYVGGPLAEGDAHQHAMSRLAEQKISNALGLYWDPFKTSDPGYDMSMGDITIDVKLAQRCGSDGCHLPVKCDHFIADIYILLKGDSPHRPLTVLGFISGMKCKRYPVWDKTSGPPAYWVPQDALTPMEEFYDKVRIAWPERFAAYLRESGREQFWLELAMSLWLR